LKYIAAILILFAFVKSDVRPPNLPVTVQKRVPVNGTDSFTVVKVTQQWNPQETAVIICDMWDQHWCKGATRRVAELAPEMNKVLHSARDKGFLIVHAPSECMKFYEDYPQRKAATKYAERKDYYIEGSGLLPSEKNAVWPIDQSNEGCNDTPRCEVYSPWKKQIELIDIRSNDVISDSGPELLGLFKERGIRRIILMGVHTNMCVINRSFGLRSMARNGMQVTLMRDMTDLMYDERQHPYVNHFEGLGLMVEYIEKYVAPTMVSTDLTGDPPFRFTEDPRR